MERHIVISEKERTRLRIMGMVATNSNNLRQEAELAEVSYRQIKRIWSRYRKDGEAGLIP